MNADIPIEQIAGVKLVPTSFGVSAVSVSDPKGIDHLSWDRYVRLNASATAVMETQCKTVLDVGGYDGALAFFLPEAAIDLIDPATTGGSIIDLPVTEQSYDCVVAVDVLEHVPPEDRTQALSELARVAKSHIVLNYPCRDSRDAQKLVLGLTNNPLVREHVDWELPDSDAVLNELNTLGFVGTIKPHTSIAIWLGQYITLNCAPEAARALDHYLVQHHVDEPFSAPLYHLLVCVRQ